MHPLIARIHPAFRTALFAWLLSRGALWIACASTSVKIGTGAPLPGLLDAGLQQLASALPAGPQTAALMLLPWIAVELLMLAAGVAVYRFARVTSLPQIAERACWLWFFNPILALTITDWGTQAAAAAGALAIAGFMTHRPAKAALAAFVAVGCRLEFILLWPALAIAGWRHYRRGKDPAHMPWSAALVVPIAFITWIGLTWHLAGSAGTSLRALHGDAAWRTIDSLTPTFPGEVILLIAVAGALLLAFSYARRLPLWYLTIALPALLWPLVQVPIHFAAITLAWSIPTFLHLAIATDDRAVERPLLVGLVIGYLFASPLF